MSEAFLSAKGISKNWGERVLYEDLDFHISKGDKVGLLGINGSGKSTLLKVISGLDDDFEGEISIRNGVRIAYLEQEVHFSEYTSLAQFIFATIPQYATILEKYHHALETGSEDLLEWDTKIEDHHLREVYSEFRSLAGSLGVDLNWSIQQKLSGGQKKRIQLCRALLGQPEFLILDEPTNHLDESTIRWLEKWLISYHGTLLFVTHDRYFLERITTHIYELWQEQLVSYHGNYSYFLEAKQKRIAELEVLENKRQAFVKQELDWARRSPMARTTKSKSRLQRLDKAQDASYKVDTRKMSLQIGQGERVGKRILEMLEVSKSFDKTLFEDFTLKLSPGDRVGLLGPNGSGKSTLLKIIQGEVEVDKGEVKRGETLKIASYHQQREFINQDLTLWETVCGDSEWVEWGDQKIHKRGFLDKMMFAPSSHQTKVSALSGGEKNRLQLMDVMLTPANMLILDEPTNDLDLQSLEVLEEELEGFGGCILLVSHDRYFLESICNSLLVFAEDGIHHLPGSYSYYLGWCKEREIAAKKAKKIYTEKAEATKKAKKKLSYKEQREFDSMEGKIQNLELSLEALQIKMTEASGRGEFKDLQELEPKFAILQQEIEALYIRWEDLENQQQP
jgi:ATP-binding cassette subfamily F protein uup